MITCYLVYQIDPSKLEAFEEYARRWIDLVPRFGGTHHGYFLPYEGANDRAVALFSFPTLAAYENYRSESESHPECQAAYELAQRSGCIRRYERSFLRPVTATNGDGVPSAPDRADP